MTQQNYNQNSFKQKYGDNIIKYYEDNIQEGSLQIGNWRRGDDTQVKNFKFLEMFNITTLIIYFDNKFRLKLKNQTIKQLFVRKSINVEMNVLNLIVDDLELENLEVLLLDSNKMCSEQLYNLTKFKKLHTLDVSFNDVDLTHIHNVLSLAKLSMQRCGLKNIECISSLVNLEYLDLSVNSDIDINPLCKITTITQLNVSNCNLHQIDQIGSLINLKVLDVSSNQLQNVDSIRYLVNLKELNISSNYIDITPLKYLVRLIKLSLQNCQLRQLSALQPLICLQYLDLSYNFEIDITALQYLKNLTYLNLNYCNLVSICVLRPLVNLENFEAAENIIVYLDANFNNMKKLQVLRVNSNRISDISAISIEKHPNYIQIDNSDKICFNISQQRKPSQNELHWANKLRHIEGPNIQLKNVQNICQTFKTTLNSLKQQVNAVKNIICSNQIQFTSYVIRFFQQLNQFE
ncbi:Conserved_hypothetical protein [Hexamita inflata]|uniref:Uncharacterized protein n=1 Tax=Hexamita inflata TaxID=28002 RepID=A0AA86UFB3_9EUKA|nr:Conserved hypothetical protein [Hexamita inflata]